MDGWSISSEPEHALPIYGGKNNPLAVSFQELPHTPTTPLHKVNNKIKCNYAIVMPPSSLPLCRGVLHLSI